MRDKPQLYVRRYDQVNPGDWTILDTYDANPIKINLQVQDVMDPSIAASSYSQTFRVPHTAKNGQFFQQVFNVNQTFFDPSKKAQAYINAQGSFFMQGNIQLMKVYTQGSTGKIEYEIVFMSETSDFATQIGIGSNAEGFLTNLDLGKYDHKTDYNTITQSWNGTLFEGDVLYPLCEWGYGYTGSGSNTVPDMPTISVGGTRSFTSGATANALKPTQFKPALRVKAIWDAIFATTGYTYESDFIGTNVAGLDLPSQQPASADEFMSLYVVADSQARAELTNPVGFRAERQYGSNITDGVVTPVSANVEVYDYGSNYYFDNTNFYPGKYIFNVGVAGDYEFVLTGNWEKDRFSSGSSFGPARIVFIIKDANTDVLISSTSTLLDDTLDSDTFSITLGIFGQPVGRNLEFFFELVNADPITIYNPPFPSYASPYTLYINNLAIATTANGVPTNINPKSALPDNIKQIDFIRSIVEKFKLVFEPSKTIPNHFIITPWTDWIQGGIVKDWTSKLNDNIDFDVKPLFQTQPRYVTFKEQEDSDYINYNYQQSWKQSYGQRNEDSGIEVIKGTKTIQGIFASLPIGPIGVGSEVTNPTQIAAANTFLIPHIAKDEVTKDGPGKRTPIQPKIRLGYYNSTVTSPITWYLDDEGTPKAQPKHPLVSSFYPTPYMNNPKLLDWKQVLSGDPAIGEPNYIPWIPGLMGPNGVVNPTGITNEDAFKRFWQKWYYSCYGETAQGATYKDFSYLVEGEFVLNYQDITDLRFNDLIFVKDAYYLVNEIKDYVVGEITNCKVTLYKVNNIGISIPNLLTRRDDVCYSEVDECSAACCQTYSTIRTLYTSNPGTLNVGDYFYLDLRGATSAPAGWYSYEGYVYETDETGKILSITSIGSPALCECVPITYEVPDLCYMPTSSEYCEACCCQGATGESLWTEDNGNPWYTNTIYWADEFGTTYPTVGYYSDGTNYVVISANGIKTNQGSCTTCNCLIYEIYPHVLCAGTTECDAVCCVDNESSTYYTDSEVFTDSTVIYSDQGGAFAPAGWYYNGIDSAQVTGVAGVIAGFGTPASCQPCANEGLDVYFNFYGYANGTGAFNIEKSFDAVNWMPLFSKDLSTIPAQTAFNYTGAIATGTFVRSDVEFGLDNWSGTYATRVEQTLAVLDQQNIVKQTPYNYQVPQYSQDDREYRFTVNVTGSPYDCSLTGGQALACTGASCIIDETNSIFNVYNDLEVCCDPLYITSQGYAYAKDATFYINSDGCTGPTPPSGCYDCTNNFVSNTYSGSGYHIYNDILICDNLGLANISINYNANERPNRYNFYNSFGALVSSSGWVGYANYPGPWGASLNIPPTGFLTVTYANGLYLTVEAGPADPVNPITDSFELTISCAGSTCYTYRNSSPNQWTGDYKECNGAWNYAAIVYPSTTICAEYGSVFTLTGTDLELLGTC